MGAPRREGDPEDIDYRDRRGPSPLNGNIKWILGMVLTVVLAAYGYLHADADKAADRERDALEKRVGATEHLTSELAKAQAAFAAKTDARWESVSETLGEIKSDVKELKRRQ